MKHKRWFLYIKDLNLFIPQCLWCLGTFFDVYGVYGYEKLLTYTRKVRIFFKKIPFQIPQKKEIHIGLRRPEAKWQSLYFWKCYSFKHQQPNHDQGIEFVLQSEVKVSKMKPQQHNFNAIWGSHLAQGGGSLKEKVQVFIWWDESAIVDNGRL